MSEPLLATPVLASKSYLNRETVRYSLERSFRGGKGKGSVCLGEKRARVPGLTILTIAAPSSCLCLGNKKGPLLPVIQS